MAIVNAWLLYRKDCENLSIPKNEIFQLATFKLDVAVSLTKAGQCISNKRGRPSTGESSVKKMRFGFPPNDVRLDQVGHIPFVDEKRQRCRFPGCPGQTKFYCNKCVAHSCLDKNKNCYASFHGFEN